MLCCAELATNFGRSWQGPGLCCTDSSSPAWRPCPSSAWTGCRAYKRPDPTRRYQTAPERLWEHLFLPRGFSGPTPELQRSPESAWVCSPKPGHRAPVRGPSLRASMTRLPRSFRGGPGLLPSFRCPGTQPPLQSLSAALTRHGNSTRAGDRSLGRRALAALRFSPYPRCSVPSTCAGWRRRDTANAKPGRRKVTVGARQDLESRTMPLLSTTCEG